MSINKTSVLFSIASLWPLNITEEGSSLCKPVKTSNSNFFPHSNNCSTAAALKVSAAMILVLRPSSRALLASFASVVVLPDPFTPKNRII